MDPTWKENMDVHKLQLFLHMRNEKLLNIVITIDKGLPQHLYDLPMNHNSVKLYKNLISVLIFYPIFSVVESEDNTLSKQ
jgi:hypothetical protein